MASRQDATDGPSRRQVLKSAAGAAAGIGLPLAAVAAECCQDGSGAASTRNPRGLIPADKGIGRERLAALRLRGEQRVYAGDARRTIGMPCGGVGAGQLYLLGDGTLGHWGIDGRRRFSGYGADNYKTFTPERRLAQGFAVAVVEGEGAGRWATLDDSGFESVEFVGEYPMAQVRYRRSRHGLPIEADLEGFSPFVPLAARESASPATVLRYEIRNVSAGRLALRVGGWLENGLSAAVERPLAVSRRVQSIPGQVATAVQLDLVSGSEALPIVRPERMLFDFESGTYAGWRVEGDAFGDAPSTGAFPNQQRVRGFSGTFLANSYAGDDDRIGKLSSEPFEIDRRYLGFLIGGGGHADKTCLNLVVDGKVVRTATGRNNERLERRVWDLSEQAGRSGRLEVLDAQQGPWGHVNVDEIALRDDLPRDYVELGPQSLEFGTLALSSVGPGEVGIVGTKEEALAFIQANAAAAAKPVAAVVPFEQRPLGCVARTVAIEPGSSAVVTFVVSWHFPNLHTGQGVMYANWFDDAADVARKLAPRLDELRRQTRMFCDTYYRDTTLPWWLVSRLMMPLSTLASGTSQWWRNGRFWGWEGVGCCEGTCTHVWNYAQGEAFLFPELARSTRTMQDLGEGFDPATGLVGFRSDRNYAADGQCGTVLKCYREHLLSGDDGFLRAHWPRIRQVLAYSIAQDRCAANTRAEGGGATAGPGGPGVPAGDPDGVIENSQHNTFDINFEGPNTFVGSLYLAALRAGAEMAERMNQPADAQRYRKLAERGRAWTEKHLFNGEYFEQRVPAGANDRWQYGAGCLSDQMFGQNWAHLLGLGHLYDPIRVHSALAAVYRYNWTPDVAALNTIHPPERWFARAGEGGLLTCTWPRGGRAAEPVRYRDEVWTGIEYQVAAGLLWEGMVDEALAILKAVDERYDGGKHNPWNEVECGDHYARALASWGAYLALCGFRYDGPAARLGFAPRLAPDGFAAFFSAAEGWGTMRQTRAARSQTQRVEVKWGRLRLATLQGELPDGAGDATARVTLRRGAEVVSQQTAQRVGEVSRTVAVSMPEAVLSAGDSVEVEYTW